MFESFGKTKNNKLQEAIERDGLEHATKRIAEIISFQDDYLLNDKKKAYQFILEEIEAASLGNEEAIRFAFDSGIPSSEYKGAMKRSRPEIDGKAGPQQLLSSMTMQLSSDKDLMVKFRTKVVDKVMKHFYFGKHAKTKGSTLPWSNESKLLFNQILNMYDEEFETQLLMIKVNGLGNPSTFSKIAQFDDLCLTICKNEGIAKEEFLRILRMELK